MKKIALSTFFSMLYYAVNTVSGFGITTILVQSLGSEVYSFYPLANNVSGWMVIISVTINAMLARHISVSYNKKDYNTVEQYYSTAMIANIVCAIVLCIPILLIIHSANAFFNIPFVYVRDVKILFALVLFTVPLTMINTVFSIATFVVDKLHLFYISTLVQIIVKLIIILWFYYHKIISLIAIGISVFASTCVLIVVTVIIKTIIFNQIKIRIGRFNKRLLFKILNSGIWNSVIQLGNSLLYQCDLVMSNIFLGAAMAGNISIALAIPSAITGLITILSGIFVPSLIEEYAENGFSKKLLKKLEYAQWLSGGLAGILLVLVMRFDHEFFDIWLPGNDSKLLGQLSIYYLLPLVCSAIFRCVGNVLVIVDQMKMQAVTTLLNGIVNIILMYVLIIYSNLGVFSIVISTALISSGWYILFLPVYVSKITGYPVLAFYRSAAKISLFLGALYMLISFVKEYMGEINLLPTFAVKVGLLGCVCYMLFFFAFWYLVRQHEPGG